VIALWHGKQIEWDGKQIEWDGKQIEWDGSRSSGTVGRSSGTAWFCGDRFGADAGGWKASNLPASLTQGYGGGPQPTHRPLAKFAICGRVEASCGMGYGVEQCGIVESSSAIDQCSAATDRTQSTEST
jgi:hypothetical protein